MDNKQNIKEIITRLHKGEDAEKLEQEFEPLIRVMDPEDIAIAEQQLIKEGLDVEQVKKLCDVHLKVLRDSLEKEGTQVMDNGPLSTLTAEHQHILNFVKTLEQDVQKVKQTETRDQAAKELAEIHHIAKHLVEANLHHQREEDVLFPGLKKKGISEPVDIMVSEHQVLKPAKKELLHLVENYTNYTWPEFKKKLDSLVTTIKDMLPSHIYKEDHIIYPLAAKLIENSEWEKMQESFDSIGYCCFTPERVKSNNHG